MNFLKNFQNAIVLDSEDDYAQKQLSFAGLADAQTGVRMQVAADMRMPITKLFGTSVSGGFQTDQNDMENYNSMVEAEVRTKLKYILLRMYEIKCQVLFGFIPDDLTGSFEPLRELSGEQMENVKTQKFNRLLAAIQSALISSKEFRQAANKGNLFDISLDPNEGLLGPSDPGLGDTVTDKDEEGGPENNTPGSKEQDSETAPSRKVENMPRAYTPGQRAMRAVKNSTEYDKAAYAADGGDAWIDPRRKELFEDPSNVDLSLWEKAQSASVKAFGAKKWQYAVWWYKKQGGKFQ